MTKEKIAYLNHKISEQDDQHAFEQLYRHYHAGLLSYAMTLVEHRELAEEVVEDVFIKIWTNRKTLATISNFSYYLYTAAKHTSLNYHSKRKRSATDSIDPADNEIFLDYNDPEMSVIRQENISVIENAINTLPEKCRLVFRLIKDDGLKYKEVAQLLGLSQKTIEAHMTLAYSRILTNLQENLPEYALHKSSRTGNY